MPSCVCDTRIKELDCSTVLTDALSTSRTSSAMLSAGELGFWIWRNSTSMAICAFERVEEYVRQREEFQGHMPEEDFENVRERLREQLRLDGKGRLIYP